MKYARVEAGEIFVMGRGEEGTLEYATGLYRATADLDFGLLYDQFMADNRLTTYTDDDPLLVGDLETYEENRSERFFQLWLVREAHVERVTCKQLLLMHDHVRKRDGTGLEAVMFSRLVDPYPELSDVSSPSPR